MYTLEQARGEAKSDHAAFMGHIKSCRYCLSQNGQWCSLGRDLENVADASGNRWESFTTFGATKRG